MARPLKSGLDYFPLDTTLDDKFELIEARYGLEGFAIIIKLFQKIYANGYYYKWGEKESLLFSNRINVDINRINDVINAGFKWQLFDESRYKKYNILTSKGIQKRYFEATKKRKSVSIIKEIVYSDIKPVNAVINSINSGYNTQSKVKKSKVKKSKEISVQNFISFWKIYPKKVGKKPAQKSFEKINPDKKLFEQIITALKTQKKTENWLKNGGQFIPHPATWLNQERWNDEIRHNNNSLKHFEDRDYTAGIPKGAKTNETGTT